MHVHASPKKRLQQVFLLLLSFGMVEIVVGFLVNSLSLQGDGWHMMLDAAGVGVALFTAVFAERVTNGSERERSESIGALVIAVMLVPTAYLLIAGGIKRFLRPQEIQAAWMSVTALAGLLVNFACLKLLSRHAPGHLHVRGARLHVLGDFLNSLAVIFGGIVMVMTTAFWIDGALAVGIGVFLFTQACLLGRRALLSIAKARPRGVG